MFKALYLRALVCFFAMVCLQACEPLTITTEINTIRERGELRVGTLYGPSIFFYDQDEQPSGFEYELLTELAKQLEVKLVMVPLYTHAELYNSLKTGQVNLIAAALTASEPLSEHFRFSPEIYQVDTKVIYRKNSFRPRDLYQVNEPLWTIPGRYYPELIKSRIDDYNAKLSEEQTPLDIPVEINLNWDEGALMRAVNDKEIRFAMIDSTAFSIYQRYFPELAEAFTLERAKPIVWMMQQSKDDSFFAAVIEFMGQQHSNQTIAKLNEKYFGHIGEFDYVDTRAFLRAIDAKLPKYQKWFEQYADTLDWRLLAAVAYQESHWEPKARSFTGVRGMMMLTQDTANYVGISNRLDPEQSIKGGAKYLQQLISRMPDTVADDERIWFALASYNIGFGHVLDARQIARLRGKNPDSWVDVKESLPLLMQKEWYKQTRYGYARGKEAYNYVNNIRQYYQSLLWLESEEREAQRREALRQSVPNEQSQAPVVDKLSNQAIEQEEALITE